MLLGANGQVKQCVWDAVERARAAGMTLAACTGRPAFGVAQKIANRLGPDNPHIFQSGAQIRIGPAGAIQERSTPLRR